MKKLLLLILASCSLILVGCAGNTAVDIEPIIETPRFIVSFYNQDELLSIREYANGDKVSNTPETTLESYTFEGWFLSSKFLNSPVNFDTLIISENLSFYGKWVKEFTAELPDSFTGYYESLNNLNAPELKTAVTSLVKNTGFATGSTSQVKQADQWENNHYLIYSGVDTYGNREHVWPKSKLGSAPEDDLHNLRAADMRINSTRSNYAFGEGSGSWKLNGGRFYPGDDHVGDVARIVLYISLRYNLNLNVVGNLEMFLKWHEEDPVDAFELTRNDRIQNIQRNRNPFIDYPDLVELIYGPASVSIQTYSVPSFLLSSTALSFNSIYIN